MSLYYNIAHTDVQIRVRTENDFSHFSAKTYVVGTQKNRLNETILLSTQNTLMGKEINAILGAHMCCCRMMKDSQSAYS